jgi:chromosome segregation ATPase
MAKENKTSIDLVSVELSEDKLNEIKDYQAQLNQIVNQLGQLHIRKNDLHTELERVDEGVESAEKDFKSINAELRKELSKLDRDYPRGQLDLEQGTITYNPALKDQQAQMQQGGAPNGVEGGQVVDAPFTQA